MAETIYTIPINDAFDLRDGCPLCRLRADLEAASLDYIMGAAMMEPDVRAETNRLGFCRGHFDKMLEMKNRLGLALMLESHLSSVETLLEVPQSGGKKLFGSRKNEDSCSAALTELSGSCYICRRTADFEGKYLSNTVHLWKTDEAFRKKFAGQPYFCTGHAAALLTLADSQLDAKRLAVFHASLIGIMREYVRKLKKDLSGFTKSFDHRFSTVQLTDDERYSVEKIIDFLSTD